MLTFGLYCSLGVLRSWTRISEHRRLCGLEFQDLSLLAFQVNITTICRLYALTVYEMNKNMKCFYLLKGQVSEQRET
jgi:hypothetical protein